MLRIQRALLLEIFVQFVMITVVVTMAVFLGSTIQLVAQAGGALGASLMLAVLPKMMPLALSFSLPFAWMSAVAIGLGRWVADHEVTALKAAGVHVRTIALPVIAAGAILGVASMGFSGYVVPQTSRQVATALKELLPRLLGSLQGANREVKLNGGRISFDRWDDGVFYNVELDHRKREGKLLFKVMAREMRMVSGGAGGSTELGLSLADALVLPSAEDGGHKEPIHRPEMQMQLGYVERIAASTLFNEFFGTKRFRYQPKHMDLEELAYVAARGGVERGSALRGLTHYHGRLSLGAAPFFMGLFSVAMLLLVPATGRRVRDFMLCFVPCILTFFPLYIMGSTLARRHGVPAGLAMWLPNLLLGAAAIALLFVGRKR